MTPVESGCTEAGEARGKEGLEEGLEPEPWLALELLGRVQRLASRPRALARVVEWLNCRHYRLYLLLLTRPLAEVGRLFSHLHRLSQLLRGVLEERHHGDQSLFRSYEDLQSLLRNLYLAVEATLVD